MRLEEPTIPTHIIKDLPTGCIIWHGYTILGITNATLPAKYENCRCIKVPGNDFDYSIIESEYRKVK